MNETTTQKPQIFDFDSLPEQLSADDFIHLEMMKEHSKKLILDLASGCANQNPAVRHLLTAEATLASMRGSEDPRKALLRIAGVLGMAVSMLANVVIAKN